MFRGGLQLEWVHSPGEVIVTNVVRDAGVSNRFVEQFVVFHISALGSVPTILLVAGHTPSAVSNIGELHFRRQVLRSDSPSDPINTKLSLHGILHIRVSKILRSDPDRFRR